MIKTLFKDQRKEQIMRKMTLKVSNIRLFISVVNSEEIDK